MTPLQILAVLLTMFTGSQASKPQPYSVPEYLDAIVQTGHGAELWWYEPTVKHSLPAGVPANVKGATNCWPPQFSGVVYLNPEISSADVDITVMHELVHLANNCHGSEHETELAAMDALAYLGQEDAVIGNLVQRIDGMYWNDGLSAAVVKEYYRIPVYTMLYGDMTNYTYLYRMLERIGVRERSFFVGRAVLEVR